VINDSDHGLPLGAPPGSRRCRSQAMIGQAGLSAGQRKVGCVIREELTRLFTWEERHRRLAARLLIALGLTLVELVP
jgi:hypothetical protein